MKGRDGWRGPFGLMRQCLSTVGRRRHGCFTLEGTRLVERALRAGLDVVEVVAAERVADDPDPRTRELLVAVRASGTGLHLAPDAVIEDFTEGRGYGPILALARIPRAPSLSECLARRDPAVLLVAIDVQDPGNVGALGRTALTCGACALAAVGVADPYHPRAVRTSMGSLFRLPVRCYATVEPLLEELEAAGAMTVAAVSAAGLVPPRLPRGDRPLALFLGCEAFGIPDELLGKLEQRVTIPMATEVDSLSVNAAAAILLYELLTREE